MNTSARDRFIFLTTVCYAVLALAWIFLSDRLLASFVDIESILWLSTAKGVFFVVVTAAAFFLALRAVPSAGTEGNARLLLESLATGVSPGRLTPWLTYAFAVTITLSMLMLRYRLGDALGDRQLLILFMFPIIFSALLGGFGPGFVATAVTVLGVDYLMISPKGSLRISDSIDWLNLGFLTANGVAVSVLSEVLRRSLSKVEMNLRLLDTVISGTPDAVFVKDVQSRYLMANAAAGGFVGKDRNELVGRDDTSFFQEATAHAMMAQDRAIMASGRTQTLEEQLTTLDGRALVFLVTKGPVFDGAGQVVGLFGISREITDRKMAENEVRRLNASLERRVAERTAELKAANLELEELAYALTHNLRAPLRAIGSFARLLVDEHGGKLDGEAKVCLEQIVQANSAIGKLLDGILALLRCTRGKLHPEPVDVSVLANRRLAELASAEPQRQIRREVEDGLVVTGDRKMLEMVIRHLLDNAWKFTRNQKEALIRVFSSEVDGRPGICVSDNGVGFDMAHIGRLFQPFQRLHRQDEFPGIGIGLAAVRRIICHHGGEIRAVAAPNAGATFCFTLPQSSATQEDHHEQKNYPAG